VCDFIRNAPSQPYETAQSTATSAEFGGEPGPRL